VRARLVQFPIISLLIVSSCFVRFQLQATVSTTLANDTFSRNTTLAAIAAAFNTFKDVVRHRHPFP
jgi:hypothetical protein